jgi:hypothetical protein
MVPLAPVSRQRAAHEPFYDINPWTGISIEVFYSDRTLETFGRCGAGWFYWARRRGFSPAAPATGPFATSYSAYRQAMNAAAPASANLSLPDSAMRGSTARKRAVVRAVFEFRSEKCQRNRTCC